MSALHIPWAEQNHKCFILCITSETIVETIKSKNIYKECANTLREEFLNFDFGFTNTFSDADGLEECYAYFQNNIPDSWELFFQLMQ